MNKHQIGNNKRTSKLDTRSLEEIMAELDAYQPPKEAPITHNPNPQTTNSQFPTNLTASDYLQLGDQIFSIGLHETKKDWEAQAKSTLEKNLQFQDIKQGMEMYKAVISAHQNNQTLFHPDGNPFHPDKLKDLYNELTSDNWQNLNARFEENDSGILIMKKAESLNNGEIVYSSTKPIFNQEDAYYNLDKTNSQGFPEEKSSSQNFDKNTNIRFWPAVDGRVARFYSVSDYSGLICGMNPVNGDGALGVRYVTARGQEDGSK